jgi:hypothetical protein
MKAKVSKSEQIRKLHDQGKTVKEIKAKLECSYALIGVVLSNYKKKKAKGSAQFKSPRSRLIQSVFQVKKALDVIEKPKEDPKAKEWAKKNPWFGVSKPRTAYALGLHEELVRSGVDAKSDEYYKKIDEGMSIFASGKKKYRMQAAFETVDPVNHPPHYKAGGVETIDFIEAKDLNYRLGNVVKYVSRAGKKDSDPVQDLEKAAWYLQREIAARKSA